MYRNIDISKNTEFPCTRVTSDMSFFIDNFLERLIISIVYKKKWLGKQFKMKMNDDHGKLQLWMVIMVYTFIDAWGWNEIDALSVKKSVEINKTFYLWVKFWSTKLYADYLNSDWNFYQFFLDRQNYISMNKNA